MFSESASGVVPNRSPGGYPLGVRTMLPDEARRHRSRETVAVGALERRGFQEVILPLVDFEEPYVAALGPDVPRGGYRFVDRCGDLVAVRSDFTPMLARALAPVLDRFALPLRLYYRGEVVRCEPSRLGQSREFYQVGAEIVGDASPDADAEVLSVATGLVGDRVASTVLVITDSSLIPSLVEGSAASDGDRRALREALASRRPGAIGALTIPLEPARRRVLDRIVQGVATLSDLMKFSETAVAAERLAKLVRGAESLPVGDVQTSFEEIDESAGYYTGLRFRVVDRNRRLTLLRGGRYDSLYGRFGRAAPAVGFTLTVDDPSATGRA